MSLHFAEKQSSESWQEGVRLENRLRAIESGIEDTKRQIFWFYVLTISVGLLAIMAFIYR